LDKRKIPPINNPTPTAITSISALRKPGKNLYIDDDIKRFATPPGTATWLIPATRKIPLSITLKTVMLL
jgi:hypothetical protein